MDFRKHTLITAKQILNILNAEWLIIMLFILFLAANSAYLDKIPGLIGDEGLEGGNVFELLHSDKITIKGGPGYYIGPITDYLRVPFIFLFGYTTLGLRLTTFLASLAFFWILWLLLRNTFGKNSLFALCMCVFSPIFLGYQRLGWAISLLPLLLVISLYIISRHDENKNDTALKIIAGIIAGIGASVHFIFIALLPFIFGAIILKSRFSTKKILSWWVFVVGFFATFGMQLTIILLYPEDQDRVLRSFDFFIQRITALPNAMTHAFSASWYIAVYNGRELPVFVSSAVVLTLLALIIFSFLKGRKTIIIMLIIALIVHLVTLNFIIGRFALRYLVPASLFFWLLAGTGLDALSQRLRITKKHYAVAVLALVVFLLVVNARLIVLPFLKTEGSMKEFNYSDRQFGSDSFVATDALVRCLKNRGYIWSDNTGILARLQYLSYSNPYLRLANDSQPGKINVRYRTDNNRSDKELCPSLRNFVVTKKLQSSINN